MGIGGVGLGRDTKIRPAPFSNKEDKLDPQTAALNYWDNQTKAVGEGRKLRMEIPSRTG